MFYYQMEILFLNTMWEKIKNNFTVIALISIVSLSFLLRFWALSTNPPSLTWDEGSWGVNAYSLSTSGKDEFGKFLPLTYLESFGDFKPPMYAYLSVIPVWLFGLNEFSVRFMSAFLGSLTVLLTYFLVKELFYTAKQKENIALVSAFLLSISPWHILLSRAAFEANVASFFIILGVLLFLIATRSERNIKFLLLSLLSFLAALYTFNTSRVFLPLFVFFLFFLKKNILLRFWKKVMLLLILPILLAIPLVLFMITPQAQLRFQEVNIFSDISVIERTNQEMANSGNSFISKIIHNRRLAYAVEYMNHYLDNFNPKFLFINGDGNPKFSIQDVGQMYLWELPFLIVGFLILFRKKDGAWVILPIWILLGVVPAATARETPHALRIETIIPALQIVSAYGIVFMITVINTFIKKEKYRNIIWIGCCLIVVFSLSYFLHNYFNNYPITYASEWQYGYKQAISFTENNKSKYEKIYFTQDLGRPYIYIMLYGKYPVDILQKDADVSREALGFVHVDRLSKYYFPKVLPNPEAGNLYVNVPGKIPGGVKILQTVYFPNGKPSLIMYEK